MASGRCWGRLLYRADRHGVGGGPAPRRDAHKRDWAAVNALASTSTILQIGFGVLGLVLALLVLPFIDRRFDIGSVPFPVVATALLIVVFSHKQVGRSVYDQVLYANHRIYQNYLIGFLSQIFRILLVVGLLVRHGTSGWALAAGRADIQCCLSSLAGPPPFWSAGPPQVFFPRQGEIVAGLFNLAPGGLPPPSSTTRIISSSEP